MDFRNIDFVQYHLSVLDQTICLVDYVSYFTMPLTDMFMYTGDDLRLAVELFGPYFVNGGHEYISQKIKCEIGENLVEQLRLLGFNGSNDELTLFFTKHINVDPIIYDVSHVQSFIVFSGHDVDRPHKYFLYSLNINLLGGERMSFVDLMKGYIFNHIDNARSDYPPCSVDISDMVAWSWSDSLLVHYIKSATYSFTRCLFYKKMRDNMLFHLLSCIGSERINDLEILEWCGYIPVDRDIYKGRIINSCDTTYEQLLSPVVLLLNE